MANRFYNPTIDKKMTSYDLQFEKKTNVILLNTIEGLIKLNGDIAEFKKEYAKTYKLIVEDRLDSDAIPLMQHLFRALENPANREIFLNSAIVNYLVKPILKGHTGENEEDDWENFEKLPTSRTRITGVSIYSKVLKCYYANKDPKTGEPIPRREETPIGLDFIAILSTFVKTDKDGEFVTLEKKIDPATKAQLLEAAQLQIDNFKSKPLFANNFVYKPEKDDDEDEYEDE